MWFNKGQRLKIPEIVPFRLIQMIETALRLTGIEGTFRANCEAIVGVLRKNKDVLLMLLEIFVWDVNYWKLGSKEDCRNNKKLDFLVKFVVTLLPIINPLRYNKSQQLGT